MKKPSKGAKPARSAAPKVRLTFLAPTTDTQEERQRRVFDALALKRRANRQKIKLSTTAAARRSGTTLKTMRHYAPSALVERDGRVDVKPTDRIPRRMRLLTDKGEIVVTVSSRDATRIADHHAAVFRCVATGGRDVSGLQPFAGKTLRSGGKVYTFVTDPKTINRLYRAGAISFLDVYASSGGGA